MERLQGAPREKMRGSMLIVAMGILALMSIMAVTFTRLMKLESDASTNYIDMIRAKLLAKSGEARSAVSLRDVLASDAKDKNKYYDEMSDEWVFKNPSGFPDAGTLVEDADKPSYEGNLGGTYAPEGNIYKVKVIDCASQININGSQARLPDVLDNLGAAIAKAKGIPSPIAGLEYTGQTGGQAIINFRGDLTSNRYSSKMQLLELFQENERKKGTTDADKVGLEKFNAFKDYVTANSWVNEKTVLGNRVDTAEGAPTFAPQRRAPVNVNTATRPVLVALLQGLGGRGRYVVPDIEKQLIDKDDRPHDSGQSEEVTLVEHVEFVYIPPLTEAQAEKIAERIEANRPFKSYAHFEYIIDTDSDIGNALSAYTGSVSIDAETRKHFDPWYRQAGLDMLKANFNPNARPNYYNPSVSARLIVDKTGLWHKVSDTEYKPTHTTEFCFSSMGYFEITSLGQVLDAKKDIVAEAKVRSVVKLFDTVMHTSQSDFELADEDDKMDMITLPRNVIAFDDPGDEWIGYFQLHPKPVETGKDEEPWAGVQDTEYANNSLLVVKFDPRHYVDGDEYSIANGEEGGGAKPQPMEPEPDEKYSSFEYDRYPEDTDVFPDGFYVSKFKKSSGDKTKLRYRAAFPEVPETTTLTDKSSRSNNNSGTAGVNLPMYYGGVEFWIKPEFDSDARVFGGYLFSSTILLHKHGPNTEVDGDKERNYMGGTQMFFFKNTSGDLRVSRLYYEAFYQDNGAIFPGKMPLGLHNDFDPNTPECLPDDVTGNYDDERPYCPTADHPIGRPLPGWTGIQGHKLPPTYPRIDLVAEHAGGNSWGGWKAGEWHHVLITWDDRDTATADRKLRLYIDGNLVGDTYPYNAVMPVLLNEKDPQDRFYFGGIHRSQKWTSKGVFKFALPPQNNLKVVANATVDNLATYNKGALTVRKAGRYLFLGEYSNYVTIPFPPGVDKMKLRGVEYAAYAPTKYGVVNPKNLLVSNVSAADALAKGEAPGVTVKLFPDGNPSDDISPGDDLLRDPATGRARVGYFVTLNGLTPDGFGGPMVSPVFDSIQVSYFLPREEVIVFEKVVE